MTYCVSGGVLSLTQSHYLSRHVCDYYAQCATWYELDGFMWQALMLSCIWLHCDSITAETVERYFATNVPM